MEDWHYPLSGNPFLLFMKWMGHFIDVIARMHSSNFVYSTVAFNQRDSRNILIHMISPSNYDSNPVVLTTTHPGLQPIQTDLSEIMLPRFRVGCTSAKLTQMHLFSW